MSDKTNTIKLDKIKSIDELPIALQPSKKTLEEHNIEVNKIIADNDYDSIYHMLFIKN
jgi:hypothetical protein